MEISQRSDLDPQQFELLASSSLNWLGSISHLCDPAKGDTMIHRGDFFGGVTAAVVALPLALAFGVASGAGAAAGLYGAIAVGFFAALFGGTPSQVSGPTGPMTVVMAAVITNAVAMNPEQGLTIAFTTVSLAGFVADRSWEVTPRTLHGDGSFPRGFWIHERYWSHHYLASGGAIIWC